MAGLLKKMGKGLNKGKGMPEIPGIPGIGSAVSSTEPNINNEVSELLKTINISVCDHMNKLFQENSGKYVESFENENKIFFSNSDNSNKFLLSIVSHIWDTMQTKEKTNMIARIENKLIEILKTHTDTMGNDFIIQVRENMKLIIPAIKTELCNDNMNKVGGGINNLMKMATQASTGARTGANNTLSGLVSKAKTGANQANLKIKKGIVDDFTGIIPSTEPSTPDTTNSMEDLTNESTKPPISVSENEVITEIKNKITNKIENMFNKGIYADYFKQSILKHFKKNSGEAGEFLNGIITKILTETVNNENVVNAIKNNITLLVKEPTQKVINNIFTTTMENTLITAVSKIDENIKIKLCASGGSGGSGGSDKMKHIKKTKRHHVSFLPINETRRRRRSRNNKK
jgi:hypothetical protein